MYRINQIKLDINESMDLIPEKILKKIGNKNLIMKEYQVVKESIDARDKSNIKKVYTVDFKVATKQKPKKNVSLVSNGKLRLEIAPDLTYKEVTPGEKVLLNSPVIVGFGPCGIFAGLILASCGYKPIIIERGSCVEDRVEQVERFWNEGVLDTESNVQFGEGGAGTFSDGKLTTGIKDYRIRKVLEELVLAGADEDILYKQKPHIGTDVLRTVVKNIRNKIISLGGEIYFNTKLIDVDIHNGSICGIEVIKNSKEKQKIKTENLIVAIGHSSRDTFHMLYEKGVVMKQKPFSMGVRIEHPQDIIDQAQFGNIKGLPPADYKLSHHCENGRGVYTFCMCPGGEVVLASSEKDSVVVNGMSNRARNSGTANSALLCDVRTEDFGSDHPLAGVYFQQKYERLAFVNSGRTYKAPVTTWEHFMVQDGHAKAVIDSLPNFVTESIIEAMPFLGKKLKGFDHKNAIMKGVETRSSSPVRFQRDENYQGSFSGFYPAGEGAGYAGGIMSAACDGIKAAEKIIEKYQPIGRNEKC